ncbi:hypothetical protein HAX54_051170 [Datura stramonium]|uniref:ANK_REP_REGION domain-containing protein n=1 Tax=Datura stramonium TaxID=4076 RepID=A0ABS8WR05_DATST|nr:hypothetical protein [Datura stramonium]
MKKNAEDTGSRSQRSSRPITIHGDFSTIWDVVAFKKLTNDNPSLIQLERNPVMVQTPLHVAAGYNNVEILKFLFARANNGMTPLHLAVWHSLRAEDYSTVKTLLEYDADCSAEDNEGMAL